MAAPRDITFVIRARDMTRGVFRRIGRSLRGLGARFIALAGVAGLTKLAADGLRAAHSMETLAQGVGTTTTEFQSLARHMASFGVDADDVSDALFSIANARAEALRDDDAMLDAFRSLGISAQELQGRNNPLDFFLMMSHAAEQAGASVFDLQDQFSRIMGEDNARRMIGALRQGPAAMAQGMMRSIEAGRVLSAEEVNGAAEVYVASLGVMTAAQNKASQATVIAAQAVTEAAAETVSIVAKLREQGAAQSSSFGLSAFDGS